MERGRFTGGGEKVRITGLVSDSEQPLPPKPAGVSLAVWTSLRSRPPSARAAAFTKRRICAWMDHLPIQEKVQELSGGLCKFRIRIERVRYAFKSVELHRDLHFPEFLEQTFATLDWDGHVRGSMEDDGRRRSLRDVVDRRCSSMRRFVASVREQHVRLPIALRSKLGHRIISGAGCKLRTHPRSSVLALEFRAVARPGGKQRQMSARGITDDADPIRISRGRNADLAMDFIKTYAAAAATA